jgi:peptidoglycan hydrolase-like protein with peptidoglycan-binding domain
MPNPFTGAENSQLITLGGYDLQFGDHDAPSPIYGGRARSLACGDNLPTSSTGRGYVRHLQEMLYWLGIRLVSRNGIFDQQTEWAVREFQSYAKMPFAAQADANLEPDAPTYSQGLQRATAAQSPYTGPVSGVVNVLTRERLQLWGSHGWRCPVIVDAWQVNNATPTTLPSDLTMLRKVNLWNPKEYKGVPDPQILIRMFAKDFSGHYDANTMPGRILGRYTSYMTWGGPNTGPSILTGKVDCLPETEMTPRRLIGDPIGPADEQRRATFKVIRAVAEQECLGFFDGGNGYDDAFISLGPCHWTLGVHTGGVLAPGELAGFLAYFQQTAPAAFAKAFEVFGVRVNGGWGEGGSDFYDRSQRKFSGWLELQQEDGSFRRLSLSNSVAEHFRTWHWFYRFMMAGRTMPEFRRAMWDMARMRLRDVLLTPWPDGTFTTAATIGDVFKSEKAAALLLRWHTRKPGHIVNNGQAGDVLKNKILKKVVPGTTPPQEWENAQDLENALLRQLMKAAKAQLVPADYKTFENVDQWPCTWARGEAPNPRQYQLQPQDLGLTLNPQPCPDAQRDWGLKETRAEDQFDFSALPARLAGQYNVAEYQTALCELGFTLAGASGTLDDRTHWAVREFQYYAGNAHAARQRASFPVNATYAERLTQVEIPIHQRYRGQITGELDGHTRKTIRLWQTNGWRCPVVIEARRAPAGVAEQVVEGKDNIWLAGDVNEEATLMLAYDFRQSATPTPVTLGHYHAGGPRSLNDASAAAPGPYRHCTTEFLPEMLTGGALATAEQRSTFKAVRAVAEQVCLGFFDSITAAGPEVLSFGFTQLWEAQQQPGEFGAWLAYLAATGPQQMFAQFGLAAEKSWIRQEGTPDAPVFVHDGLQFYNRTSRHYQLRVARLTKRETLAAIAHGTPDNDYLRSWHWFYRLVTTARQRPEARRAVWDMIRLRLRDVLDTPWPGNVVPDVPMEGGNPRRATLRDVYTSEKAIALLLYWHLRFPANMFQKEEAAGRLLTAFRNANIPASAGHPGEWRDEQEALLLNALLTELGQNYPADFVLAITQIAGWQCPPTSNPHGFTLMPGAIEPSATQVTLKIARNTFRLDGCQLTSPIVPTLRKTVRIRRSSDGATSSSRRFGLAFLTRQPEGSATLSTTSLEITDILLTLPGAASTDPENGLRLPVRGTLPQLPVALMPSDETYAMRSHPADEPVATPLFDLAPGTNGQLIEIDVPLELARLLPLEAPVNIEGKLKVRLRYQQVRWESHAELTATMHAPFLRQPLPLVCLASEQPDSAKFADFLVEDGTLRFDLKPLLETLRDFLPVALSTPEEGAALTVAVGEEGLRVALNAQVNIGVNLGSPLVRLQLGQVNFQLASQTGLQVTPRADLAGFGLYLNLFAVSALDNKVIDNIWGETQRLTDALPADFVPGYLFGLKPPTDRAPEEEPSPIVWTDTTQPFIPTHLLTALSEGLTTVNLQRKLAAFAGEVLGQALPTEVTFDKAAQGKVLFEQVEGGWRLRVPLLAKIGAVGQSAPVFTAEGEFSFSVIGTADAGDGYLQFKAGDFQAEGKMRIVVPENYNRSFGELISLHIPQGAVFELNPDPRNPEFKWIEPERAKNTPAKIGLRVPASEKPLSQSDPGRFTFEFSRFSFDTAGFNLRGAVRAEGVDLGAGQLTGFADPLAVKGVEQKQATNQSGGEPPHQIGEIEFKQSRLIYGSLQASAKLNYFDDAVGTFALTVMQNQDKTLAVIAGLKITGLVEYHLDQLFATFQFTALQLQTRWSEGRWSSDGSASGSVKFLPAKGRDPSEMGELARLFDGLTLQFEEVNPVNLGFTELSLRFMTPKQFEFAQIFKVEMQGIRIFADAAKGKKSWELLGDITIQNLPGVDAQLSFGGLELEAVEAALPPKFKVKRIGAGFSAPGGFSMQGHLEWIDNAQEMGFGGVLTIKSESLPKLTGLIKLTRLNTPFGPIPSLAMYFETDVEIALFAGFFLRSVGLGLGIYQGLRGLTDKSLPLPQRLVKFVDDPQGLPNPRQLASWTPHPPQERGQINWMLVAAGMITLGKLPSNQEHPLTGSILLALDQDLDLVAGVNIWLFCSPDDARANEFQAHPVGRGAIGISPREQKIFAYFRTLKQPKLGKGAPPLLAEVLSQLETSLMFLADTHGFLLEIGWPWETRLRYQLGPLRGLLTSGFRFGFYRGVISYGLNFAINAVLEARAEINFKTPLGRAGAVLSVYGEAYFRCSFAGALDRGFQLYLLGDVRLGATVQVTAEAHCELSVKICFVRIRLRISFRASFSVSISAALTAAMDLGGIGFDGYASIAVSVCGFRLSGRVPFRLNEGKINSVRKRLDELMPKRPNALLQGPLDFAPFHTAANEGTLGNLWHYRFCRAQEGNEKVIRVLLFPQPGLQYPPAPSAQFRFSLDLLADFPEGFDSEMPSARLREAFSNASHALPDGAVIVRVRLATDEKLHWQIRAGNQSLYDMWSERDHLAVLTSTPRFKVRLKTADKFLGFLGSDANIRPNGDMLEWSEDFDYIVHSAAELKAQAVAEGDVSELRSLTLRGMLQAVDESKDSAEALNRPHDAATQFAGAEKVDPRTLNPVATDADDETQGIAPAGLHTPNLKRDHDYDRDLATASTALDEEPDQTLDNSAGLNSGLLISELVTLLKDNQVKAGTAAPKTTYTVAPPLRLILVFKDDFSPELTDPVTELLDIHWPETVLGGTRGDLEGVLGAETGKVEYDLVPGFPFQSSTQVCLTWTFKREDRPAGDPKDYAELHEIIVERTNLRKPQEKPATTTLLPTWMVGKDSSGKEILLRPQYQFVDEQFAGLKDKQLAGMEDEQIADVQEGDVLLYRVRANALEGRKLAETLISVVRTTVRPLDAPAQAQVLHQLSTARPGNGRAEYQAGKIEFAIAYPPTKAAPGDATTLEEQTLRQQLRLRYRLTQAAQIGIYGYEQSQHVKTAWKPGLPPQTKGAAVKINFADAEHSRALLWEDTEELRLPNVTGESWQRITTEQVDENTGEKRQVRLGFRLSIDEAALWNALPQPFPEGMAVELLVGREDGQAQNAAYPLQRSRLVQCRHALKLPENAPAQTDSEVTPDYFSQGNTVTALESLPDLEPLADYLEPRFVQAQVQYANTAPAATDVRLNLTWRHDPKRGAAQPAAGYRIYRFDRYVPDQYRPAANGTGIAAPAAFAETFVSAVPEAYYRAFPDTIEAHGLMQKDGDGKTRIEADWRKTQTIDCQWSGTPLPEGLHLREDHPSGPIWLHFALHRWLEELRQGVAAHFGKPEIKCVLKLHEPLEDQSREIVQAIPVTAQIAGLSERTGAELDPCGWWGLEALGLSCEFRLEDGDGQPIDWDAFIHDKAFRDKFAASIGSNAPIGLLLFQAEDGGTLLHVARVLFQPNTFTLDPIQINREINLALGLRFKGRLSGQMPEPLVLPDQSSPELIPLAAWLLSVGNRLAQSLAGFKKQEHILLFRRLAPGATATTVWQPELTLPINREGLLKHTLTAPDQWAHEYLLAFAIERRYDRVWRALRPNRDAVSEARETPVIPFQALTTVPVRRTHPLVPHNVVATPLSGSVQSLVFSHPAAFAAAASALNAARGQYSGQTVLLQRRIGDTEERGRIASLYQAFDAHVDWGLYQQWLDAQHYEEVKPGPQLLAARPDQYDSIALKPVPGTDSGFYAADRYVFPDLPAYYEYRVGVYSSAGLARSPLSLTDFVTPLYDAPLTKDEQELKPQPRQTPRTIGCRGVTFNDAQLTLRIRLVHPRFHMREEVAPLWVEAEERFLLKGQRLRYGSLPDLYLAYQVYLVTDKAAEGSGDPDVLKPLAQIIPPLRRGAQQLPFDGFELKPQIPGILPVLSDTVTLNGERYRLMPSQNNTGTGQRGEVYFEFSLDFTAEPGGQMRDWLRRHQEQPGPLIGLSVTREGIRSRYAETGESG